MPKTLTLFTVWVSSPADTRHERDSLRDVVDNLNKQVASKLDLLLSLERWEDCVPLSTSQSNLHQHSPVPVKENDVFVGILRNRLGTPLSSTFGNLTGTEYEFKLALDSFRQTGVPHVLIYASGSTVGGDDLAGSDQQRRVSEFKRSLKAQGLSFREFGDTSEFARQVYQDIGQFLAAWASRCKMNCPDTTSVFISYSREDAELIAFLASQLAAAGIRAWYDTSELRGGDDWIKKIADAIEVAHVFLLVASESALDSPWVRREVEFAARKNKPIIPVERGQTCLPNWFEFQFGGLQRLSLDDGRNQVQFEIW